MCRMFKVSRSGYYHWLSRKASDREINNQETLKVIKEIHQTSKGRYGSPKITHELIKRNIQVSRPVWLDGPNAQACGKSMRMANIKSIVHKRFRINTTDSTIIIRWLKIY
jgi:hypothetical protein